MKKGKEAMLTDYMDGFKEEKINYNDYELSFRRWLISMIDSEKISMQEARDRFHLSPTEYKKIIKRWQERYSDEIHLSLQAMSAKERTSYKSQEKRIKELEKQLELAQMKNVALNTMIDIAENDYKLEIRKKVWTQAVVVLGHMYPLTSKAVLCGLFGFSRQAWYDSKKRQSGLQMQEVFILSLVKQLRKEHKRMGAEKLHRLITSTLREHNIKYGRDKFYFLLREHGLLVKRRKRGPKTTNSNHFYRKYPNLVREIELLSSGRLWVSDITYIRTEKGFVYLSLVTDAYSKKIVGWCLWPDLTSEGALNALRMAVAGEGVKQGLIHHSDRGIQYCCNDYVNYLKGSKINISMTENGDPYENAIAERVNGILKDEYDLNETFPDYHKALEATKVAVYKYNNKRPHRSVDFMFPVDAHLQSGPLKKHWKKRVFAAKKETGEKEKHVPTNQE